MSGVTSEEVALDFKDSLSDLQMNNRYEISNLTIIAKENIEHAQALSKVLENHIRTTSPTRKLPALYVLDSIVKNIGSPFTIYLGRNLFSTFMEAYTLVDPNVRRSMESMLKTWKESVPGSMDPTPVFPAETTRVIENALNKAKSVLTRQPGPPRPGSTTYRNTPTPPQQMSRYGAPPQLPQQNGNAGQQGRAPQHTPNINTEALLAALSKPPPDGLGKLNSDIDNLIDNTKSDFARNPFDTTIQQRLKALLDLQTIVKTQRLPPEALTAIKAQVSALSATARPSSGQANPPPPASQPAWQPPTPAQVPAPSGFQPPPNLAELLKGGAPPPFPPPQNGAALPIFAPGSLEALISSTTNGQKPSTPTLRQALPNMTNMPGMPPSSNGSASGPGAQSLIDALRGAGLASSNNTPNPPAPPPLFPPPPGQSGQSAADLLKALSGNPLLSKIIQPPMPAPTASSGPPKPRMPISQAALKSFRPDLLATLYTSQPNQCPTCALRFPATQPGRDAKAAHLDWHFRLNQRIADSQHRGLHRLWFPDEMEWIKSKEVDVSRLTAEDEEGGGAKREEAEKRRFVLAGKGKNQACPICQEAFKAEWSDEVQDWVWMDTVEAGGRMYHANCFDEVSRGAAGGSGAAGVLGKRKADDDGLDGLRAKLRT